MKIFKNFMFPLIVRPFLINSLGSRTLYKCILQNFWPHFHKSSRRPFKKFEQIAKFSFKLSKNQKFLPKIEIYSLIFKIFLKTSPASGERSSQDLLGGDPQYKSPLGAPRSPEKFLRALMYNITPGNDILSYNYFYDFRR